MSTLSFTGGHWVAEPYAVAAAGFARPYAPQAQRPWRNAVGEGRFSSRPLATSCSSMSPRDGSGGLQRR